MCHSRTLSNRTFRLHKRFRIICNEKHLSFRCFSLRGKRPYSELFWSELDWIRREIRHISPYSFRVRENVDQNNSEYGHFLRSVFYKDWSVSIQTRNLQSEVFKNWKGISPKVFSNILISVLPENFSRQHQSGFSWTQARSEFNGTKTIALLGPKVWNLVLLVINKKKICKCFLKHNDLQVLHCLYWFNFIYI